MISDFAKIKRKMCGEMTQEAFEYVQGGRDTEYMATLFMSFLCPKTENTSTRIHTPMKKMKDLLLQGERNAIPHNRCAMR
jgi:hypothetical protein